MPKDQDSSFKKSEWDLKGKPIAIILGIIIITASISYSVIDKLLIEQYRLENARLEKAIDQQTTITNLNELVESLRIIMKQQNNLLDSSRSMQNLNVNLSTQNSIKSSFVSKKITEANQLIQEGNEIAKLNSGANSTYDLFILWRNKSLSYVRSIDEDLKLNYEKEFSNLTELALSNYQEIPSKVKDGIITINTIKHVLEFK